MFNVVDLDKTKRLKDAEANLQAAKNKLKNNLCQREYLVSLIADLEAKKRGLK